GAADRHKLSGRKGHAVQLVGGGDALIRPIHSVRGTRHGALRAHGHIRAAPLGDAEQIVRDARILSPPEHAIGGSHDGPLPAAGSLSDRNELASAVSYRGQRSTRDLMVLCPIRSI